MDDDIFDFGDESDAVDDISTEPPLPDEVLSVEDLVKLGIEFEIAGALATLKTPIPSVAPTGTATVVGISGIPKDVRLQRCFPASGAEEWRAFVTSEAPGFAMSHMETGPDSLNRLRKWLWKQKAAADAADKAKAAAKPKAKAAAAAAAKAKAAAAEPKAAAAKPKAKGKAKASAS